MKRRKKTLFHTFFVCIVAGGLDGAFREGAAEKKKERIFDARKKQEGGGKTKKGKSRCLKGPEE